MERERQQPTVHSSKFYMNNGMGSMTYKKLFDACVTKISASGSGEPGQNKGRSQKGFGRLSWVRKYSRLMAITACYTKKTRNG